MCPLLPLLSWKSLSRPILQFQLRDSFEFPQIVADKDGIQSPRVCGDPQIIIADRRPCPLKMSTQNTVGFSYRSVWFDNANQFGEAGERVERFCPSGTFFRTEA